MIRSLPSITTTVSSDREIGLYHAWSPDAWTSRALGRKFLHFSKNAMCCRVSVFKGPQGEERQNSAQREPRGPKTARPRKMRVVSAPRRVYVSKSASVPTGAMHD